MRLIVTADDLGMSPEVNLGIMSAHDRGIVTSTCVIVGAPHWQAGVASAAERSALSLGLHLAFGESVFQLMRSTPSASVLREQAESQLSGFMRETGRVPAFVNTHQHAQLLPRVLRVVLDLCSAHGIEAIRLPADRRPWPGLRPRSWLWPLATTVALLGRRAMSKAGMRFPDAMLGGPDSGRLTVARLGKLLRQLGPGTTELVVHPRSNTEELAALTDAHLMAQLDARGVERIGFERL